LFPSGSQLVRFITKEAPKKGVSKEESDTALHDIELTLRSYKERGWPKGVPVICINDFQTLLVVLILIFLVINCFFNLSIGAYLLRTVN